MFIPETNPRLMKQDYDNKYQKQNADKNSVLSGYKPPYRHRAKGHKPHHKSLNMTRSIDSNGE